MTKATPKRKSPWRRFKRRVMDGMFNLVGARALAGIFKLLERSLKVDFHGKEHYDAAFASGRPVILAFFHEDMISIFLSHIHYHSCPIGVLVSPSRDGEMMSRVVERHALVPVRASATRGAVRGFLEIYRYLKSPRQYTSVMAIALDGPRGPRRVAKPGATMLARKAGALILPVVFNPSRKITFNSWDKQLLALPFARLEIYAHPLIDAAEWPDDAEQNARRLSEILIELKAQTDTH